jgi:hypothetical protein
MALWLVSTVLLACGGGSTEGGGQGTLTVSPTSATVEMGTSAVTFSSQLTGASGGVRWELSGPGSISTTNQVTTEYTPPATGGEGTATLTVIGGGTSASVEIGIANFKSLALSPSEAQVAPRSDTDAGLANFFVLGALPTGLSGTPDWGTTAGQLANGTYTPPDPATITSDTQVTVSASLGPCTARSIVAVVPSASLQDLLVLSPMKATVYAGGPPLLIRGVEKEKPFIPPSTVIWAIQPQLGTLSTDSVPSGVLQAEYTPPVVVSALQTVQITMNSGSKTAIAEITVAPAPVLSVAPVSATVQAGRGGVTLVGSVSSSDIVRWSLSPAIGSLSASTGARTTFTPPSSVTSQTNVTISAIGGDLQRDVVVTIDP